MANHVYQQVYEDGVDPKNVTNLQYDNNLEYVKSVLHIRPFGADFYDYGNYTCEVKIGSDINNKSVEVICKLTTFIFSSF